MNEEKLYRWYLMGYAVEGDDLWNAQTATAISMEGLTAYALGERHRGEDLAHKSELPALVARLLETEEEQVKVSDEDVYQRYLIGRCTDGGGFITSEIRNFSAREATAWAVGRSDKSKEYVGGEGKHIPLRTKREVLLEVERLMVGD